METCKFCMLLVSVQQESKAPEGHYDSANIYKGFTVAQIFLGMSSDVFPAVN